MKKVLIIILAVIVLLVGLAASGWWWLTSTRAGAEWALNRAAGAMPSLEWQRLDGDLRGGLVVHGLSLDEDWLSADIGRVELAVRVQLPPGTKVDVHWLRVFDSELRLPPPQDPLIEPEPFSLPDLTSPVAIRVRELLVQSLDLHLPNPETAPVSIDRLSASARYFDQLTLESLELTMPDLDASLSGYWGLDDPFAGELLLVGQYRIETDLVQQIEARIAGNLDDLLIDLDARGPVTQSGRIELSQVIGEPGFEIELSGGFGDWPGLGLAVEDLAISGQGRLDDWQLELSGQAVGPDIPENRWRFDLGGDLEQIDIRSGQVEIFDGRIDLAGRVALPDGPQAVLGIDLQGLDLTTLYPEWPDQARLDGRIELDASTERLIIENISLTAPPSPMRLAGSGRYIPESDELALDLRWSDLNWPPVLDDSEPLLNSQTGSLQLTGLLSDWQLELDAVMRLIGQPEARLDITATGDLAGAEVQRLSFDAGAAGQLEASGTVGWDPEPVGDLELRLQDFDVGQFVEAFPGRVDAELGLSMRSPSDIRLDLRQLEGMLRDQPLSGSGQFGLAGDAASGGTLNMDFGDNQVVLSSDDGQLWQFELEAPALHQIAPAAMGGLRAEGDFDFNRGRLALQAELTSGGWGDITLNRAGLEAELDWQAERPSGQLRLNLDDLDLNPWERIDHLELVIDGDCLAHTARLNLAGQRGTVDLGASGAMNSCELDRMTAWTGTVDKLFIGNTLAGDWELNRPLELALAPERISASRGCLVEAADRTGRICLNSLEVADDSRVAIGIEQVPMDLLLVPFDPIFNLTTPLSGELEAAWSEVAGIEHVAGFLELGTGALKPLGVEDSLLQLESIRLDLIPEPDHLRITLDALLEGESRLTGQAQLIDLNDLSSATIDANARLNLPDIGVFNRLVAELDQLGGRLAGEMEIRGALLGPSLDGQLRLEDGLIVHAPLGLKIEDLALALDGTDERATLSGQMSGGEGQLDISSELELIDGLWQFEGRVEGERFSFADVSWLQLSASPEIHLTRSGEGVVTLNGDIHVDRLRAGMPPGSEQRVNASADVRVRGEVDEEDEDSELGARLQGRLGLHLGDDARLSAIGMQARMADGLELLWDRQSLEPRVRGVIRIPEGSYRAYGQNLEIEDGEIIFTGHAIDNPSLNIDAVREIFGDPQVEAAGVSIRGNARDPRISLFTEPPTSEENALAYVVTGANFDHASGQAAINVGFYLLPRLFVSYGIGLFEAGNVLSGRFELSQRWGVRVVSGERDTGVDLSYSVDR